MQHAINALDELTIAIVGVQLCDDCSSSGMSRRRMKIHKAAAALPGISASSGAALSTGGYDH